MLLDWLEQRGVQLPEEDRLQMLRTAGIAVLVGPGPATAAASGFGSPVASPEPEEEEQQQQQAGKAAQAG